MLVQDVLKKAAHSGHLFVFRGKRAQLSTFYIRFSFRDDHVSLASAVWTNAPGVAIPAWQGFDVHLHA
jgi:transposase